MAKNDVPFKFADIPCCPTLDTDPVCDVIDIRRRLVFPTHQYDNAKQRIRVEVIFHTRFTRCSGPLALGDLVYTTTLLPGESVRLATTDRRSRFSFDTETNLSYHSEQMSEEQYRMTALRAFMSDENVVDRGSDRSSSSSSWDFHGDAGGSLGFFSVSADTNAKGSHNGRSASDYLREHRAHAEMSDHQSVEATRQAHSLSIGEVSTRAHQQGQSEDHYESASRVFKNPNQGHAVTFLFYRINKTETIRFELVSIERRVIDPVALMPIPANPIQPLTAVSPIKQELPTTAKIAQQAQVGLLHTMSQFVQPTSRVSAVGGLQLMTATTVNTLQAGLGVQDAINQDKSQLALDEVDEQLVKAKLIDQAHQPVSKRVKQEIDYERKTSLPTAGVIVKGCLDDCNILEPDVIKRTKIELDHLDLENQLLKRQIELLEKSQEYRCCPEDSDEEVKEAEPG